VRPRPPTWPRSRSRSAFARYHLGMPSNPCSPGCICGRHRPAHNKGKKHPPGCGCNVHRREFQPCGTYAGYQQHHLRREPPCEPCIQAHREYKRQWQNAYQMGPEQRRRRLESFRKYRTGMTDDGFARLLVAQNGQCAICGTQNPGGQGTWHIDHDHACCPGARSCGECIRGLLCGSCNPALGLMHDDANRLQAAIRYLASGGIRGSAGISGRPRRHAIGGPRRSGTQPQS
jgi:hypothetical protein